MDYNAISKKFSFTLFFIIAISIIIYLLYSVLNFKDKTIDPQKGILYTFYTKNSQSDNNSYVAIKGKLKNYDLTRDKKVILNIERTSDGKDLRFVYIPSVSSTGSVLYFVAEVVDDNFFVDKNYLDNLKAQNVVFIYQNLNETEILQFLEENTNKDIILEYQVFETDNAAKEYYSSLQNNEKCLEACENKFKAIYNSYSSFKNFYTGEKINTLKPLLGDLNYIYTEEL